MIERRRVKRGEQFDKGWVTTTENNLLEAINDSLNKISLKIVLVDNGFQFAEDRDKVTFHIEPITEEEGTAKVKAMIDSSKKLQNALTKFNELAKIQGLVCSWRLGVDYDDLTCSPVIVLCWLNPKDKGKFTKLKRTIDWAVETKKRITEEFKVTFSIVLDLE